jgi:hypothetical protein
LACPKAQSKVKVLFVSCERNVPRPLDDIFMSKLDGPMQDVAIETPITSMEGETTSTSQVEGAWIYIPPTNNIKGPNKSTNNPSRTFQQVSLQEG